MAALDEQSRRAARRAAVRRHHPDRGGDAEALRIALAEVDRRHAPAPHLQVRRTRRARLTGWVRRTRVVRATRARARRTTLTPSTRSTS